MQQRVDITSLRERPIELQRKAESYFKQAKSTFSSDTRQSMKRWIIAKHLTAESK